MKLWAEKGLNLGPAKGFSTMAGAVKQSLAQKLITEVEHSPYSPDLATNDSWLFQKIVLS